MCKNEGKLIAGNLLGIFLRPVFHLYSIPYFELSYFDAF